MADTHTLFPMAASETELEKPADNVPPEKRLEEAAVAADHALAAQGMANKLRETARTLTDPKKREKMLTDAYNKEVEAHGSSKKARMLQSGAFQGTLGGAGVGGVVGVGLGTVVGTVVGTVTSIPATGVGALVGCAAGAVHGPFIKLGSVAGMGGNKDEANNKEAQGSPDDDDAVPDPEALRKAAKIVEEDRQKQREQAPASEKKENPQGKERRKPRKLEIRSGQQPQKSS